MESAVVQAFWYCSVVSGNRGWLKGSADVYWKRMSTYREQNVLTIVHTRVHLTSSLHFFKNIPIRVHTILYMFTF